MIALAAGMAAGTVRPGWSASSRWSPGRWRTRWTAPTGSWPGSPAEPARPAPGVDVLCDVAAQIGLVAALSSGGAWPTGRGRPIWLVAVFAGTWMVNLVTSVLQSGPQAASMVASRSLPVRLVKLIRDYGAVILADRPGADLRATVDGRGPVAFTAVNGLFLLASIAFSARSALR